MFNELLTTLLEVLGLFLLAAGATAALLPLIGWSALAAGGLTLIAGSALFSWLSGTSKESDQTGR